MRGRLDPCPRRSQNPGPQAHSSPAMKAAFNTFYWEILWKNRLVFVALVMLFFLGATLAWASLHAASDAWWLEPAGRATVVAFLVSLFLGVAPFTLMETQAGWRMNSMITRWFVLPVPTVGLVFVPLFAASVFIVLLVTAWVPILNRLAFGLDHVYLTVVVLAGLVAVQTLAWTVPRRPGQFWTGAALLLPVVLVLALGPQDLKGGEAFRLEMTMLLSPVILPLMGFAWYAACRNRCGDWPGGLPLELCWQFLRQGGATSGRRRDFRSASTALFWSDSRPALRLLVFCGLALALAWFLLASLVLLREDPKKAFGLSLLYFMAHDLTPIAGLLWMAVWGLYAGGEPSTGFRTRLSSFRATLPVTSGALAAQRILTLCVGWCLVWLPPLALTLWWNPAGVSIAALDRRMEWALFMAVGAQVLVGALPLYLWGRFEGLPNLLLAALGSWVWLVVLGINLFVGVEGDLGWRWTLVWVLLALKFAGAAWALVRGWRVGYTTWRFPVGLVAGWVTVTAFIVWGLPQWHVFSLALLVPLTRLAWCPLAVAANRHR